MIRPIHYSRPRHPIAIRSLLIAVLAAFTALTFFLSSGCGTNPVSPENVISGTDQLFAPKNSDASFTFQDQSESFGSFELKAYVTTAIIRTPQGSGVYRSDENLGEAPEDDGLYKVSEECGYHYYYMRTNLSPPFYYAKVFIHTLAQDEDGITIGFNWWLQTEAGERNFQ